MLKKYINGEWIEQGGGSGTAEYPNLNHKPQINGVTLQGNLTGADLDIQNEITPNDPLNADLVDDSMSTNKFVSEAEKALWSGKLSPDDAYTKAQTDTLLDEKADLIDGKVPSSQLPSYVDDVLEYSSTSAFPATGESGKIYVATDTNKTYRWGGSAYAEISESLALGETASTAYPGNKGKANADAIAAIKDGTNIDSFAEVETALAGKLNTSDIDNALSSTSTNPVQNKAVQAPIARLVDAGAKNLFDLDNSTFTSSPVNTTTATKNTDGSVLVSATGSRVRVARFTVNLQSGVIYRLSGCPSGGGPDTYSLDVRDSTNAQIPNSFDIGSGSESFTVPTSGTYYLGVRFANGYTTPSEGIAFYPMICKEEDYKISSEFVPYAPSNRELYEEKIGHDIPALAESILDYAVSLPIGIYFARHGSDSGSDKPETGRRYMYQIMRYSSATMTLIAYDGQGANSNTIYMKNYTSNQWGPWIKFTGTAVT